MKAMKKRARAKLWPGRGCWSTPTAEMAVYMVFTHSSVVLICHRVKVASRMLS
jgi:hypothetical protein